MNELEKDMHKLMIGKTLYRLRRVAKICQFVLSPKSGFSLKLSQTAVILNNC